MAVDWKEGKSVIAEEMAHQWLASEVLSALQFNLEGSSINEDDPVCDATFLTSSKERNLVKQQDDKDWIWWKLLAVVCFDFPVLCKLCLGRVSS